MSDSLFRHSFVMFFSIMIANVFAYIFHIYMARVLGPASYGELGSLLAVFSILAVPLGTIQTVIARFAARFNARKEDGKVASLMFSATKKLFIYGLLTFIFIAVISPLIANFLKIDSSLPVIFVGLAVLFSVILPINRGVLQGVQNFSSLAWNNVLESVFRLLAGIILVYLGLGVNGALLGFALGYLFAFFLAFFSLKHYFNKRDHNIEVRQIYKYAVPVLLVAILINLLTNLPTVFIKHHYSSELTGYWNVAFTLSRIILFAASSVTLVMFSKVSSSSDANINKKLFNKSLIYIILGSLFISLVFYVFSELIISVLFGAEYSAGAIFLQWLGFGMLLLAVLQVYLNYLLAKKKTLFN